MPKNKTKMIEFDLAITKASFDKKTGTMRWAAVTSDTDMDSYNEAMSMELYQNFINRAERSTRPPEEFCSDGWCGGMPYVSLSHYPDLDGDAIPGDTEAIYIDGNRLKAKGTFRNTDLGRACFKSVCDSLYGEKAEETGPIRISIGFLDYKHSHDGIVFDRKSLNSKCPMCAEGMGGKVYLDGHLLHLALTRVPVNKRTIIEAEVGKAMTTRKEDAASIVGTELADEIDQKAKLIGKSEAVIERGEDETVEKQEAPEVREDPKVQEVTKMDDEDEAYSRPFGGAKTMEEAQSWIDTQEEAIHLSNQWYMLEAVMSNIMTCEGCGKDKKNMMKKAIDGFKSSLEMKALTTLSVFDQRMLAEPVVVKSDNGLAGEFMLALENVLAMSGSGEEKLMALQPAFESFGNLVKEQVLNSVVVEEPVVDAAPVQPDIARLIADALAPLNEQIKTLNSKLDSATSIGVVQNATPVRRSVAPVPQVQPPVAMGSDIKSIVRRSVFLNS